MAAVCHLYIQYKETVKDTTRWHKTLSASAISKQVSRCCINFLLELTCQIMTNQSIEIGLRAWPTRDYGEKSQKHLKAGWIPEPAIRLGDTGQLIQCFDSCQLIKTWMYNIRLQAPKLARKCEIKHWYTCGVDGWTEGWVVDVRSRDCVGWIDFLSYGAPLKIQNWARDQIKYQRKTYKNKKYVTSIGTKMSPRYSQVMMVSGCSSLTAVN